MTGKEEIAAKGYMEGKYVSGAGNAHRFCAIHRETFGCEMYGTFNIQLRNGDHSEFTPSIMTKKSKYYFLRLKKGKESIYAWAVRDHKSHQIVTRLEVISKELIPDSFKEGKFGITIYEPWDDEQIKKWAKKQYWFQTFPFTPTPKANSEKLWNLIDTIDWEGQEVLDIGSHYGFFSFKASQKGASVTGFEVNKSSYKNACVIRDNIIQQDVYFTRTDPEVAVDVILYLSVHHQPDPSYSKLQEKIVELKMRTRKHLFVELILPPKFPQGVEMSDKEIDCLVGMSTVATYQHNVRGRRRVYRWDA